MDSAGDFVRLEEAVLGSPEDSKLVLALSGSPGDPETIGPVLVVPGE